jgi:hypothetical protein
VNSAGFKNRPYIGELGSFTASTKRCTAAGFGYASATLKVMTREAGSGPDIEANARARAALPRSTRSACGAGAGMESDAEALASGTAIGAKPKAKIAARWDDFMYPPRRRSAKARAFPRARTVSRLRS